ncbi:MAG: hypothetical protein Q8Q89_00260 [bacterium]|nr:hypothetical protein [bacterium]
MSEILTMIEDGGELNSWLSFNGKQSVLIDYNGLIFMAESSELLIFINPEGSEIVNRYIH